MITCRTSLVSPESAVSTYQRKALYMQEYILICISHRQLVIKKNAFLAQADDQGMQHAMHRQDDSVQIYAAGPTVLNKQQQHKLLRCLNRL